MNDQAEEIYFRRALSMIMKVQEERLQEQVERDESIRAVRRRGGRPPRRRKLLENVVHRENEDKIPREELKDIIDAVVHKLQRSLRRYNLTCRSHATFSFRCTEVEFIHLLKGYAAIRGIPGRYKACLEGNTATDVLQKLSEMLGGPNPRKWVPRRYYGNTTTVARDCSYIKLEMKEMKKKKIIFEYKTEKTHQIDRDNVEHVTSMGKLICKYPRSVSAVQCKKVLIHIIGVGSV